MKKFTLTAIASLLMTASAFAGVNSTVYVTNKAQYEAALASCEGFTNDDKLTIVVCKSLNENGDGEGEVADNTVVINSNYTLKHNRGTVVLRSNQTDIDNLPQMQLGVNGMEHAPDSKFSWICENVSLQYRAHNTATSGQIFYWQKMTMDKMQLDSIIFRNCEITNIPRTLFRTAPTGDKVDAEGNELAPSKIQYLEMTGCKVHDINISKGNNWALFVIGSMPVEMKFSNNMFYDMPYSKGIVQMAYVNNDGTAPKIWFNNNTVMLAKAKYDITPAVYYTQEEADSINAANPSAPAPVTTDDIKTAEQYSNNGCCIFNMGEFLSPSTEYYVYNNIFMSQQQGVVAKPTDAADYTIMEGQVDVLSARAKNEEGTLMPIGYLTAKNNYTDAAYKVLAPRNPESEDDLVENNIETAFEWTSFFKPENSNFISLKTNPFFTLGTSTMPLDLEETQTVEIPSCVGAPIMYVEEFPAEAKLTTAVAGEYFGEPVITISPAKEVYKKGDKVTVAVTDAAGTALRQFNNFKGWSGDATAAEKTFEIELTEAKEYKFTATFEKNKEIGNVLAAWYSSTGKDMQDIEAQIGAGMLKGFGADTTGCEKVLQTQELPYVAKAFQTRTNKFGEDPKEAQVCTYNIRTAAAARDYNRDYALIQLSTKGKVDAVVNYFVGSDNNASKTQNAYWSLDGQNWTLAASADLSAAARDAKFGEKDGKLFGWAEVNVALPAECNGKDTVFVKLQGAVKGAAETEEDIVINNASFADFAAAHESDVFEYITNILVTATDFDLSAIDKAIANADSIAGTLKTEKAKAHIAAAIKTAEAAKSTVTNKAEIDAVVAALNAAVKDAQLVYDLTPLKVTESVVYMTNPTTFATYKADGWMSHSEATPGSSSKKGTITPDVNGDITVSATNMEGINTKESNRNSFFAVTGVESISAYFNYNGGRIGAIDIYGTDKTAVCETPASNTSSVATLDALNPNETYYIRVHASADLGWYAVKLIAGKGGVIAGDANNDGVVSVADLSLMASCILGSDVEINKANADVNGDGEITVADLSKVASMILAAEARAARLAQGLE